MKIILTRIAAIKLWIIICAWYCVKNGREMYEAVSAEKDIELFNAIMFFLWGAVLILNVKKLYAISPDDASKRAFHFSTSSAKRKKNIDGIA